ncbi:hypothetical protein FXO38_26351 [Capsicum annuum]|nr:hypothetical protein FXO38_26351 [Capsicum annuum]
MGNLTITYGNDMYTNAVELIIDSVVSVITNAGYSNMKIMIGEIGWPTDGYPYANHKSWCGGSALHPLSKRLGVRSPPLVNEKNYVVSFLPLSALAVGTED